MTILAQFNDCHCCNDARSLVQKEQKKGAVLPLWQSFCHFICLTKFLTGIIWWIQCSLVTPKFHLYGTFCVPLAFSELPVDVFPMKQGKIFKVSASLILFLLEGKTDCPLSGVFGAGKNRIAVLSPEFNF